MQHVSATIRRLLPLLVGTAFGLLLMLWTTVQASALLPNLFITSITDGVIVSGLVSLSARADATGFSSLQFQVSGQDVGVPISSGTCLTSWDSRSVANGLHTVTAVATDGAGNRVAALPVIVLVSNVASGDSSAPSVTVSSPSLGATIAGTTTLTATASDNVGVAGVWFTVDGSNVGTEDTTAPYQFAWDSAGVANGTRVIRALARDAAGNTTTSSGVSVTVNNAPQDAGTAVVTLTAPAADALITGTITLSATSSVAVSSIQFTLDGANIGTPDTSSPYSLSWASTTASNGPHTLRAVALRADGTTASSGPVTVTVNNTSTDTTLPTVSLTSPNSGATVRNTITISASASDNVGVASVQFSIDGVDIGAPDLAAPYSISWNTAGVANGSRVIRATARDLAGNSRTSSRTVNVTNFITDITAPTIVVSAPGNGATVAGSITLSATASDNVGIVGVQFAVDGVDVGAEDTSAPYDRTWTTTQSLNGTHVITATARDAAGNRQVSAAITVTTRNLGTNVPGDLNDDGRPDLLFSHASGQLYSWFMNDDRLVGQRALTPESVNPVWQVVSVADFNNDRKSDILWQHAVSGDVYLWFMDGTTLVGETTMSGPTQWRVGTTGDLNGDGNTDIVWQLPANGQLQVWFMRGTTVFEVNALTPVRIDPSWRLVGSADLNRDGRSDLVWQNDNTGQLYYWLMDSEIATSMGSISPSAVNVTWQVRAVADFDRDGNVDLLFQHASSGQLYLWHLQGTTLSRHGFLTPSEVHPAWRVVGQR